METALIKPYEISVWKDELTQNGLVEHKLAVIGSNTMTGPNKVYDPVFNKKANGEKTLTFSLKYKYFDVYEGKEVDNVFTSLLVNESKVKLWYDDEWYEFIVKEHSKSSEENAWTYTCTDAFVLELSKQGYNITFDLELNNNQGTARELAKETLKDTSWRVGNVDLLKQLVDEPLYKGKLVNKTNITIINASDNGEAVPDVDTNIYVFYNYVSNENGKYVQFIKRTSDTNFSIDDQQIITATNYRITTDLVYAEREVDEVLKKGFWKKTGNNYQLVISLTGIENQYQGNRLVYKQLTTYDPVMQRTVDCFKIGDRDVYRYIDYTYTTSGVIMNYITNGDNFNVLEDGTLQGWNPYVDFTGMNNQGAKIDKLELVTKPELGTNKVLADISTLSSIEGFLKAIFKRSRAIEAIDNVNYYRNLIYNSGVENNTSSITSISKGDKFVFRWRAGERGPDGYEVTTDTTVQTGKTYYTRSGSSPNYVFTPVASPSGNPHNRGWYVQNDIADVDCLVPAKKLRLMVAKYTQDEATRYGYYYKHININDVIIDFTASLEPEILDSKVTGGVIDNNTYKIDDVAQTPSTKYIYTDSSNNTDYVWDGSTSEFKLLSECPNYLPYYYVVAEAKKSVTNRALTDPTQKYGIFIYDASTATTPKTYYIEDIQLTRYVEDGESGEPMLIGNMPTATSNKTEYYYFKPEDDEAAEDVITYTSATDIGKSINEQSPPAVVPIYNEDSEKILSITASQSNCFDILQTIAETFECWIDLRVPHDDLGYIETDGSGAQKKYVDLKEYAGDANYAGFRYGVNLQSIERTINSEEFVTKLIVDQSQSDYVDEGYVSIAAAQSNVSGESYILNFDYYYNQGLLDRSTVETDRLEFITNIASVNLQLKEKEKTRGEMELALTELGSKRNVITELVDTAKETKSKALDEFEELTGGISYDRYREIHNDPDTDDDEKLTEEDTLTDLLGELYINSATINNYAGVLTNVEQEYWNVRKQLRGSENYVLTMWVDRDANDERHVFFELSDYLSGFSIDIGDAIYEADVSTKYFDITTTATTVEFSAPTGYTVYLVNTEIDDEYTINDGEKIRFRINSDTSVVGLDDEIEELRIEKDNLTRLFNRKYSRYLQEGTWNSTDYISSELYYLDALQVSNTSAQPTVSYTINVVEISEVEGYEAYLFDAGQKTYVEDTEFFGWAIQNGMRTPFKEEVFVSEVEWHLEEPDKNTITVQNYKNRFEDFFQRISATVQTVQYNEASYIKTSSILDNNGTLKQDAMIKAMTKISGSNYPLTSDGSISINGDEILIRNLTNPANRVIINSEGIRVSSDGGVTWATALNGQGLNIGLVYTGSLNTDEVIIGSRDNPSFRWDKSGISAFGIKDIVEAEETALYDLKTYVRFDEYGLYGVKNNEHFKANSLSEVLENAHFAVTWDGFFIKNNYPGGGKVEITSDNDFRVLKKINNDYKEVIKIGALEWTYNSQTYTDPTQLPEATIPSLYGIRITNDDNVETFKTGTDGNITITGVLNATGGTFTRAVQVGNTNPYISIDGENALIETSNFSEVAGRGWRINKDGDAVFNNITARGAIKTAVFEYAEIQAVGGLFIFRPSSTIKGARVGDPSKGENASDLIVKVEKPFLFAKINYNQVSNPSGNPQSQGWYERTSFSYKETTDTTVTSGKDYFTRQIKPHSWCKISNYTNDGAQPDISAILATNGLSHVYEVTAVDLTEGEITLENAAAQNAFIDSVKQTGETTQDVLDSLEGGALIDMGRESSDTDYDGGIHNYGIGVNSSDNTVNLPARSISLFETNINSSASTEAGRVTYDYKGIFGTLPSAGANGMSVNSNIYSNMVGKQGIFTNNIYIGDETQFLAFYTENGVKKLRIVANELLFESNGDYHNVKEIEAEGIPGPQGDSALQISIMSTFGTSIRQGTGKGALYARITKNGTEIDAIGNNVIAQEAQAANASPSGIGTEGQGCIVIYSTDKDADAYIYKNSSWTAVSDTDYNVTYLWTFRDKDNQIVSIPGIETNKKCIYIDDTVINKKLTAEVKVIVEEANNS